jgi:hypothetical protein
LPPIATANKTNAQGTSPWLWNQTNGNAPVGGQGGVVYGQ